MLNNNFLDDVMRLVDKTQRCVLNKDTKGATRYLATLKKSIEAEINVAKDENIT
jgi:hypothetical protein